MSSESGGPAVLGPSWRSSVAEEARTRGFASLAFARFAPHLFLIAAEEAVFNEESYVGRNVRFGSVAVFG